jgi:hypothetical protein
MPRGTEIGALGTKLWHRSPPFRCSVRHPLESIMTSEPLQSHPSRARLRHLYPAPIGPESIIKNFLSKYGGYYPNDYHIELVINSNPSIQYDVNPERCSVTTEGNMGKSSHEINHATAVWVKLCLPTIIIQVIPSYTQPDPNKSSVRSPQEKIPLLNTRFMNCVFGTQFHK